MKEFKELLEKEKQDCIDKAYFYSKLASHYCKMQEAINTQLAKLNKDI